MTLPILCKPPGDDVSSKLAAAFLHATATVIAVQAGDVARFGTPTASAPLRVRLVRQSQLTNGVWAVGDPTAAATYRVTGVSGSTLTGVAFESGTNQDFAAGDLVAVTVCSRDITDIHARLRSGAVNVLDSGTVAGDGVTDDGPAINAILAANPGRRIFFPTTSATTQGYSYYSSVALTLAGQGQAIAGEGGRYAYGTLLKFAPGASGIVIPPDAAQCEVRDLVLVGSERWEQVFYHQGVLPLGYGGVSAADGVRVGSGICRIVNVTAIQFGRHGFNLSNADSGGTCDNTSLVDCYAMNCRGHGLLTRGGDANAGHFDGFQASVCQLAGIMEDSFLGNTYLAPKVDECHFDNAQGSVAPTRALASAARSSGTVTLTFAAPYDDGAGHGFVPGLGVTVAGAANPSFNGTFVVASVAGATLTYAQAGADASSSGGTGRIARMVDTWAAAGLPAAGAIVTGGSTINRSTFINPYVEGGCNATGDPALPGLRIGSGCSVFGATIGCPQDWEFGNPTFLSPIFAGDGLGSSSFLSVRWARDAAAQYREVLGVAAPQQRQRRFDGPTGNTPTIWREDEGPAGWRRWHKDPDREAAVIRFGADLAAGGWHGYANSESNGSLRVNADAGTGSGGLVVGNGDGGRATAINGNGLILTPIADSVATAGMIFLGSDHGGKLCRRDGSGVVHVLTETP